MGSFPHPQPYPQHADAALSLHPTETGAFPEDALTHQIYLKKFLLNVLA